MVDAAASFDGNRVAANEVSARPVKASQGRWAAALSGGAGLVDYAQFCASALYAPAQSASWVSNWAAATGADIIVATLACDGRPALSLALEVVRRGPFKVARFPGGRHANGNFAAVDPRFLPAIDGPAIRSMFKEIAGTRPDIDLTSLERLLPDLDGVANPLAALPSFPSPNLALAVDLDGGFDALLSRASGKRKRKKHRSQTRKFEAIGTFRRIEARTPEDVERLLGAFLDMKEVRFAKMGIANVFGDAGVRAFFRALFTDALTEDKPSFLLHGLDVAGKLRAVTGSSRSGKRLICEFGAIADDDLAFTSPGDFLFFDNIQEACELGFDVYDFSVGDEPYKRLWCDIEVQHFEVLAPLTLKGRALAAAMRQGALGKAFIKNNPTIWKLTKMLRRKAAGQAAPAAAEDDS
ncbi:GNAT family N-acetyltransferase [Mesorhizobium sp. M2D.F.Ca.ET.185.01.1.1]|uniref:GNAT family N-acetyltransferase n=1 Tax=unclassified Mesorhizobium TaxID=325217 RepID=UPI000FCA73D4|nr:MULTISPECIES: GNAT family N-acetyltransferase [unclassified Mesorhizobium]TGP73693.1 GNAT family N-acetyltransferase [bacterium M00.F.Ca.ET.227.01.1.1]TGP86417.1 GNAT family N-acetyltransferase [bacterium M00.F.Ca.ET.221.01.1.1]TGP86629.1 GNAT family N-acetyltransferase [bacterium M00.F.Ca.ET.222.01.1.1]TGU04634.1 GNAT family N-acetyltransferase [bacterium M00.F.Ca.ET.163.01.1.1]TGU18385.1 GNAT family N-acetyltransferase [bacterium M00.F.Ca.ET.156.01.1.1]TGU43250.1 GNAT family N-acetyltran